MISPEDSLYNREEVTEAVLAASDDHSLAIAAGISVDPEAIEYIASNNTPVLKQVYSITPLVVGQERIPTFRTITFGTDDEETITRLDAVGTDTILRYGNRLDNYPVFMTDYTSKFGELGIQGAINSNYPVGAAVTYENGEDKAFTDLLIVSSVADFVSANTSSITLRAIRGLSNTRRNRDQPRFTPENVVKSLALMDIASKAQKQPLPPVVVPRPLFAQVWTSEQFE